MNDIEYLTQAACRVCVKLGNRRFKTLLTLGIQQWPCKNSSKHGTNIIFSTYTHSNKMFVVGTYGHRGVGETIAVYRAALCMHE